MTRARKSLIWLIAVLIGLVIFYSMFEYTLVPELRERVAGSAAKQGSELGALLFETRGCSGCHALGKLSSATFGPDLSLIAEMASANEIRDSIANPDAKISENCPNGPCSAGLMPAFSDILDEHEIDALVTFLQEYSHEEL